MVKKANTMNTTKRTVMRAKIPTIPFDLSRDTKAPPLSFFRWLSITRAGMKGEVIEELERGASLRHRLNFFANALRQAPASAA